MKAKKQKGTEEIDKDIAKKRKEQAQLAETSKEWKKYEEK